MTLITKPDYTYVWASGGAVVAPNDSKKQLGWVAEAPPFQYDNWLQNRQDQMLAHINQRGIAAWDGLTNYEAGGLSYVQGSDGKVYKSVAASGPSATVQNPTTDGADTYWTVAFADVGAFLTQVAGDARYTQRSNNLSDVTNAVTARTNLGLGTISTQSAASVNITGGAITGITDLAIADGGTGASTASAAFTNIKQPASETGTGVVELATLAEMAAGTSTSLVPTVATVMSLFGKRAFTANDYIRIPDVPGGLIIQWGPFSVGVTSYSFPIAFPTAFASISCMQAGTTSSSIARVALTSTPTNSNFTTAPVISNMLPAYWTAIGY